MKINKQFIINLSPCLFLFILTCFLFGNSLIPKSNQILSAEDIKHAYYPYREFLRNAVFNKEIPFWNPYLFSGRPFIAEPHTQFFYPTTLLLLPLPSSLYFSLTFFLHVLIAGIGMYMLLTKFSDKISSLIGSVTFSLSGYFAARIYAGHIDYVVSTALIPLIFLFSYEYIVQNNKKSLFYGAIVICLQLLTGFIKMTWYIFSIICLFHLFTHEPERPVRKCGDEWAYGSGFRSKRSPAPVEATDVSPRSFTSNLSIRNIRTKMGKIIFIFLSGAFLSSIYLLPGYQFISHTIRNASLSYVQSSWGATTLQSLLMFVDGDILGSDFMPDNQFHGPPPNYHEHVYFVGKTPLIIIALGFFYFIYRVVIKKTRGINLDKKILALLIISVIAILISLGPNFPINFHLILWTIHSIYKSTRGPERHLSILVFTLPFIVALILKHLKQNTIKISLLLLISIELIAFGGKFIKLTTIPSLIPTDSIINKEPRKNELVRILPDFTLSSEVKEKFSFAAPLIYKYFSTSGYTPAILSSYYDFIDKINGNVARSTDKYNAEIVPSLPFIDGISFLNTKYIITDKTADFLYDETNIYNIVEDKDTYRIYQTQKFLPRFFFVRSFKTYADDQELNRFLINQQTELKNLILIRADDVPKIKYSPNCKMNSLAQIKVQSYDLNRFVLSYSSECNGFLSTSEVYFPGWKAKIDNQPADILLSNLSFRALNIPAGEHSVTFYYSPTIYYLGGLISLAYFIFLIIYTKSPNLTRR